MGVGGGVGGDILASVRETKDSPKGEDVVMNSFETTARSGGIQTAVRRKSKIDGATGDGNVICTT